MGDIFKIAVIVLDAIVIATIDNEISKILGIIAIIIMVISLLLGV